MIAPPVVVVAIGNFVQSSRSWTHVCDVGFQVKPRLSVLAGAGVGLRRIFT